MRKPGLALFAVLSFALCVPSPAQSVAHNVMLSWKPQGQPWHFAFFAALPLPYGVSDLTHPRETVVGIPALKQRLSVHAPWRHIAWRDLQEAGRVFPPADVRDDICT